MIEDKFLSRLEMADRVLEFLIPTAKLLANPLGLEAVEVLKKWDHQANPDSRGAVFFIYGHQPWGKIVCSLNPGKQIIPSILQGVWQISTRLWRF